MVEMNIVPSLSFARAPSANPFAASPSIRGQTSNFGAEIIGVKWKTNHSLFPVVTEGELDSSQLFDMNAFLVRLFFAMTTLRQTDYSLFLISRFVGEISAENIQHMADENSFRFHSSAVDCCKSSRFMDR
jgi:uncharacterized membrane protein YdfJ with MMPL/SSD domain